MTGAEWNRRYPVGTPIILTLADGKRVPTRTRSAATMVGSFYMIEVEYIERGTVPLTWCWPIKGKAPPGSDGGA